MIDHISRPLFFL